MLGGIDLSSNYLPKWTTATSDESICNVYTSKIVTHFLFLIHALLLSAGVYLSFDFLGLVMCICEVRGQWSAN
jgi:hypothetical protein